MGIAGYRGRFDFRALLKSQVSDLADYQQQFDRANCRDACSFAANGSRRATLLRGPRHMLAVDPSFRFTANTYNLQPHLLYLVEELNGDFHGAETELYLTTSSCWAMSCSGLSWPMRWASAMVTSGVHWEFEHVRKRNLMNVFKPVIAAHYASAITGGRRPLPLDRAGLLRLDPGSGALLPLCPDERIAL